MKISWKYTFLVHSFLFENIAWASMYATKLKKFHLKQKHEVCILLNKDKLTHSKRLFEIVNVLNAYQINIYQHLNFMHKFINNQILSIFSDFIKGPDHKSPTNFSHPSFYWKRHSLNSTNIIFPFMYLNYGIMLLTILLRNIFNFILSFKRKLNQNLLKLEMKSIIFNVKINKLHVRLLLRQS